MMDGKPLRILLVEDDNVDRMAFERLVKKEGLPYDLVIAGTVAEAKVLLHQGGLDLALIDHQLPDGSGLGYAPEDVLGQGWWTRVYPGELQGREARSDMSARLNSKKPLIRCDLRLQHKDGNRIWTAWSETLDPQGGLICVGRDITDRMRAAEALRNAHDKLGKRVEERTAQLTEVNKELIKENAERKLAEESLSWKLGVNTAIAELSSSLISSTLIEEISCSALEHAKQLTGSRFGYVGYIDPHSGNLVSTTLTRDIWDVCQVKDKVSVFKHFTGLWGWVLKNKQPLMTNDPSNDPRSSGTPEGHIPIHRFISAPAMIDETLVGQIALANSDQDYTEQDLKLIERMAALYAIAVQRNRNENELRKFYHAVEQNPSTVIMTDLCGKVEYVNPKFTQITGYTAEGPGEKSTHSKIRQTYPQILQ